MARFRPVGIDLGTTYSAAAWIDDSGRSVMIANGEGDLLTPSVVYFDDCETIVGREAKRVRGLYPDRVADTAKRDMGQRFYRRPVRGRQVRPEVIQACILRSLKNDIVRAIGPDYGAVVTVPAYFDELRRQATWQAAEMADLKLLDIVNEPTAAALSFGEQLGYLGKSASVPAPLSVLVYDLGGGTFDATLVDLAPGMFRTVATDGDVWLGGADWDARLLDHIAEQFIAATGAPDPRHDAAAYQRLLGDVEEAKRTLSARGRATVRVEHGGSTSLVTVSNEEFESLTADLLERTAHTTWQVLRAAGREWRQVDRLLLVGGATRMPIVGQMLARLSGKRPDNSVHADEAVARGAAWYARHLLPERDGSSAPLDVTNVSSHSLGIEAVELETNLKFNKVLIPRNAPLPARKVRRFVTRRAGQPSIVVQVLEGESRQPAECVPIGRTIIGNLPPHLPAGSPIKVTYEYDSSGRLQVQADVVDAARTVSLVLQRDRLLKPQQVDHWKRALDSEEGFDAFERLIDETVVELLAHDLPAMPPAATHASLPSASWDSDDFSPAAISMADAELDLAWDESATQLAPAAASQPPVAAAYGPAPPAGAAPPGEPAYPDGPAARSLRGLPMLVVIAGFVLSSLIGVGLGYYVLCWLRPEAYNVFHLPVPAWNPLP